LLRGENGVTDPSLSEKFGGWVWPGRITDLCTAWKAATTDRERKRILSELWLYLNMGLTYYVRTHGETYGHIDPEDARDIASEKAMVFLRGLESEPDVPADPARICAYVSTLARNGLVDRLRKSGRERDLERKLVDVAPRSHTDAARSAEVNIQHSQFLDAISACIAGLSPRARLIWFMRAFLDLPSRKIAAHPDVAMSVAAIDMMLSRTRRALRECMEAKGFNEADAPTGTFLALWDLLGGSTTGSTRSDNET
jgi:RNA polymerase sigma factor (sigma-70 family)